MSEQTQAEHHLAWWRERMDTIHKTPLLQNWQLAVEGSDGDSYCHIAGLYVIVSFALEDDGCVWQHLSASYRDRVPNHREMTELRDTFIGENLYAYAVWLPKDKYVNIHPHCLHLWHRCTPDDRVLPEFSGFLPGSKARSI